MVLNKFAFLTRQGLGKTLTHVPQTFVAGTQSSYASSTSPFAPFGNHASGKFGKAGNAHLHTSFQGPSSPAAVQNKAAQTNENNGDRHDSGLAAYYDAWQKQHQPGTEEKEWKQFQFTKRIGWKAPTAAVLAGRAKEREDLALRADARLEPGYIDRAYSTSAVDEIKKSDNAKVEAEALASIDEAIAKEINEIKGSAELKEHDKQAQPASSDVASRSVTIQRPTSELELVAAATPPATTWTSKDITTSSLHRMHTTTSEPVIENTDSMSYSNQIAALKEAKRYAEIPPIFELMTAEGVRPTAEAFNGLLAAVIHLPIGKHQRIPKALDTYTSLLRWNVLPCAEFCNNLIHLLASRVLYVSTTMKAMDQQRTRFDGLKGYSRSLFKSKDTEYAILAEDDTLTYAVKIFDQLKQKGLEQLFSPTLYQELVIACAINGRVEDMLRIYSQMEANKITPVAAMFPPMIEAFGACGDLASMVLLYDGYRSLAISSNEGKSAMRGRQDNEVYAAVIKAYVRWGRLPGGEKFLAKILESYVPGTESRQAKIEATQDVVFVDALIQQHVESGNFPAAFQIVEEKALTDSARDRAFVKISVAAADQNNATIATTAYSHISESNTGKLKAAVAMLALRIRRDEVDLARSFWSVILSNRQLDTSFVEPSAMYANMLIQNGRIDEALNQAREAFARIRASSVNRSNVTDEIDEAIEVIGAAIVKQGVIVSGPAAITFLRAMVENGGLVSPIAEQVIAFLGYEQVLSLSLQDLTIALQVQADMLAHSAPLLDVGHAERFTHLVGLAMANRIYPDQTLFERVERAARQLSTQQPEILGRWQQYGQSLLTPPYTPIPSMTQSTTPVMGNGGFTDSYDPYASKVDIRASNIIVDALDNHKFGIEAALNEAVLRVQNMRRLDRHPRYIVYAKLITTAAKAKRFDIVRNVHGMAEQDVPLTLQYATVRHGWTLIFDAMIGACLTMGKRTLADRFHEDLLSIGSVPTANTFGLYIVFLKESTNTFDEASEAVRIFQYALSLGVEPTPFLYNALFGKLGKARRIDDCLHYFTQMRNREVHPTSVTYGTLVNACCRVSDERMAEQLFEEMESQPNYQARAAPYNSMIQFFLTTKRDSNKVLAYYERMRSLRIQPTPHTYKLLIDTYATLEPIDLTAAEGVLQTIRASGQKPEAVHYASLIHAKGCNLKDMEGAKKTFDEVMTKREVLPRACLYQALFESMVANHKVAATEPILADMASNGMEITPYIANTLIHGWANEKNIAKAQAIYNTVSETKREPSTYEAMTRAYLTNGDRASAVAVVNEMKSKRYPGAVENKVLDLLGPNAGLAGTPTAATLQDSYTDVLDAQYA